MELGGSGTARRGSWEKGGGREEPEGGSQGWAQGGVRALGSGSVGGLG